MADLYTQIVNFPVGNFLAKNVGLPVPTPLERWEQGSPLLKGKALVVHPKEVAEDKLVFPAPKYWERA